MEINEKELKDMLKNIWSDNSIDKNDPEDVFYTTIHCLECGGYLKVKREVVK
jgi:hypothetical protein